jgi:hypothetical protein
MCNKVMTCTQLVGSRILGVMKTCDEYGKLGTAEAEGAEKAEHCGWTWQSYSPTKPKLSDEYLTTHMSRVTYLLQ